MRKFIYPGILLGLVILTVLIVLPHPLATNDGPVHLAFSHLILTSQQAAYPLQHQMYTIALKLNPNLLVYLLMASLMRIFSAAPGEKIRIREAISRYTSKLGLSLSAMVYI